MYDFQSDPFESTIYKKITEDILLDIFPISDTSPAYYFEIQIVSLDKVYSF